MIPARDGWTARFGRPFFKSEPVVAWDDQGYPLVYDDQVGRLCRASDLAEYESVGRQAPDGYLALPGGGWVGEVTFDGVTTTRPVVMWMASQGRHAYPVFADDAGATYPAAATGRVWHPGHPPEPIVEQGAPDREEDAGG